MVGYVHAAASDNLITLVQPMKAGEKLVVDGQEFTALNDIPIYHKMAVADIRAGMPVYKYGEVMGVASQDIRAGEWAHIHNIDSTRGRGDKAHR
ncbi:MAG: UxaA family hydrolase [Lachnospiraceae bacterium]|nr:UxaA family hydrolase [Lachnospiraceae bacterium]MCI8915012.1 UxaA family hydrolase [Lawsonibacter sp.]